MRNKQQLRVIRLLREVSYQQAFEVIMKSAGKVVYQQHSAVMYNCQERRKNTKKILISDRLLCKWNR